MTPHQYQAYVRYITFLPTPTVRTPRAIVFLSFNSKISYHHHRFFDAAPFCLLSNNLCNQRFCRVSRWKLCALKLLFDKSYQFLTDCQCQTIFSICSSDIWVLLLLLLLRFHGRFVEPFAKSRGFEKLIQNLFSSPILRKYHLNHSNRRMECAIYWKKINDFFDRSRMSDHGDRRHVNNNHLASNVDIHSYLKSVNGQISHK